MIFFATRIPLTDEVCSSVFAVRACREDKNELCARHFLDETSTEMGGHMFGRVYLNMRASEDGQL